MKKTRKKEAKARKVRVRLRAGEDPHVHDVATGEELACSYVELRSGGKAAAYLYTKDKDDNFEAEVVRVEGVWLAK